MRKEGRPGTVFESLKQRYDSQLLEGKEGGILIGKHILILFFSCTFFDCLRLTFVVGFFHGSTDLPPRKTFSDTLT